MQRNMKALCVDALISLQEDLQAYYTLPSQVNTTLYSDYRYCKVVLQTNMIRIQCWNIQRRQRSGGITWSKQGRRVISARWARHAQSCFHLFGVSGWSGWVRGEEETLMTINASNIANTIFRNEKIPSERSRFICFCFLY